MQYHAGLVAFLGSLTPSWLARKLLLAKTQAPMTDLGRNWAFPVHSRICCNFSSSFCNRGNSVTGPSWKAVFWCYCLAFLGQERLYYRVSTFEIPVIFFLMKKCENRVIALWIHFKCLISQIKWSVDGLFFLVPLWPCVPLFGDRINLNPVQLLQRLQPLLSS